MHHGAIMELMSHGAWQLYIAVIDTLRNVSSLFDVCSSGKRAHNLYKIDYYNKQHEKGIPKVNHSIYYGKNTQYRILNCYCQVSIYGFIRSYKLCT